MCGAFYNWCSLRIGQIGSTLALTYDHTYDLVLFLYNFSYASQAELSVMVSVLVMESFFLHCEATECYIRSSGFI